MHLHLLLAVSILFNSIHTSLSDDPHWDYQELGPDVWQESYPLCGGTSQSPINIKTACTTYQSYAPFEFTDAYSSIQDFLLTNNGHTISGKQVNASAFPLKLSGGGLSEPYIFQNFHLHWGENHNSGSEHQLNGQKYAGEIHFVHTNAAGNQNAVLGFFMQSSAISNSNNSESSGHRRKKRRTKREIYDTTNLTMSEWKKYFDIADNLNQTNDTVVISLNLATLMGTNLINFYRYSGSLTTPPCTENVIWSVFQAPIVFTETELSNFREQIYFEDYRGPQPIYGRTVYRNFVNSTPSSIPDYACCGGGGKIPDGSSDGNSILLINRQLLSYSFLLLFSYFFLF